MTIDPNDEPSTPAPEGRSGRGVRRVAPNDDHANDAGSDDSGASHDAAHRINALDSSGQSSSSDDSGDDDYFNREQFNKSQFGAASYERPRSELGRQPRTFRSRGDRAERGDRQPSSADPRSTRGEAPFRSRSGDAGVEPRARDDRRPPNRSDAPAREPRRDDRGFRDRAGNTGDRRGDQGWSNADAPRRRSFDRDRPDSRPTEPRTMERIDTGSRFGGRTSGGRVSADRGPAGRGPAGRGPTGRGPAGRGPAGRSVGRGGSSFHDGPKRKKFNPEHAAGSKQGKRKRPAQEKRLPKTTLLKVLVSLQWASRSIALRAIQQGRVLVNDIAYVYPNVQIKPDNDVLTVDGNVLVRKTTKPVTIVYHKPSGVSGSREDGKPSLYSAVAHRTGWYMPVGSLTRAASGIVILSNDPAHKSVSSSVVAALTKDIRVKVHRNPKKTEITKIQKALKKAWAEHADDVSVVHDTKGVRAGWIKITYRKGAMRDVMMTLKDVGLEPLRVVRSRVGPFNVDDVHTGAWYRLTDTDVLALDELAKQLPERDDVSLASIWDQLSSKLFGA